MSKNNNLLMFFISILVVILISFVLILSYIKKPNKNYIKEIKELAQNIEVIDKTSLNYDEKNINSSKNLIFIINTSSNLTEDKLSALKNAMSENIKELSDDTSACLITFDKEIVINTNFLQLNDENKLTFIKNIETIQSNRKSRNYDALIYGINLALEKQNCEIIYICTNEQTNGKYTYNDINNALSVINFPINTISYDENTEINILSEIAKKTNGSFSKSSADNILDTINKILND